MPQSSSEVTSPVPNLAFQSIVQPALMGLSNEGKSHRELRSSLDELINAFKVAEECIPGISQEVLAGILRADGYSMNINEILLRCSNTVSNDFQIERAEPEFVKLEKKANELKSILGKIPDDIKDRTNFLQTIKDIASAIKELLDSVNQVLKTYQDQSRIKEYRKTLEQNKREFVKFSKSFSDTLKQYFKDQNDCLGGPFGNKWTDVAFCAAEVDLFRMDLLNSHLRRKQKHRKETKQRVLQCQLPYQPNQQYSACLPDGGQKLKQLTCELSFSKKKN